MKKIGLLCLLIMFNLNLIHGQSKSGSNLDLEGFKFEKRIKGPKHKNSKIIELMVDEYDYYFAITYKGPKGFLTLIVYELYTWNVVGTYNFKSRAELYNSYFKDDGSVFYVNTDIYKQKYAEIILKTGEMNILGCTETPNGCEFLELQKYTTEGHTIGNNYYFMMDENRKNDIKIYVNKDMIFANAYLVEEEEVVEEPTEKVKVVEKVEEKVQLEEIEVFLTEAEIEEIKAGKTIYKQGVQIILKSDSNRNLLNKVEGDFRYVLLTLIDLSKLSFGNKVTNNSVNVYLKN